MDYKTVRNLLYGTYMIDPQYLDRYEMFISSFRNGIKFEAQSEPLDTVPYMATVSKSSQSDSKAPAANKISVHSVFDLMMKHDTLCGPVGTKTIGHRLSKSDADDEVFAHIIRFESPGGAANSVIELSEVIEACEKPVFAWVDGICCSAAMYVASYCKEIYSHRSSDLIGSIGSMAQFTGVKSGEKDGSGTYHYRVYATKSTKKNVWYEDAINNGNIELIQTRLNDLNEQFHSDIKANRPNVTEEQLSGDTFQADQLEGTLIDGIKTFAELVDHISEQHLPSPSSSNNNQQNNIVMNDIPILIALLGVESLESADGAVSLSTEHVNLIEQALATTGTVQSTLDTVTSERDASLQERDDLQTQLDAANAEIATLQGSAGGAPPKPAPKSDGEPSQLSTDSSIENLKEANSMFNQLNS